MNKENLLQIYTAEQLADMYLLAANNYDRYIAKTDAKMEKLKGKVNEVVFELSKRDESENTESIGDLEFYKRRASELEAKCQKQHAQITNLEEENGRLQAHVDTYRNQILPRATKEAYDMLSKNQFAGIRIVSCEEWAEKTTEAKRGRAAIEQIDSILTELFGVAHNGYEYSDEFKELLRNKAGEIDRLKEQIQHHEFAMMQVDDVLVSFLGVTHEIMDKPSDFEKVLQEAIDKSKTVSDFLPQEPIKVADILIQNYKQGMYEIYEKDESGNIIYINCGDEKIPIGTGEYVNHSDLRQIAEHLLVYCSANEAAGK